MGLLDTVADVASGVADIAPIPGSDLVAGGIDAVQGAFGGGNGNGRASDQRRLQDASPQRAPGARTTGGPDVLGGGTRGSQSIAPRQDPGPSPGFSFGGAVNPPFGPGASGQFRFGLDDPSQGGGQQMQQQGDETTAIGQNGFSQALVAEMLEDAVQGSTGRAVLEAMQAGSLQGGVIQQPVRVETPRGVEFHSRPGFRTVTLNGQKVSVFKPLAKAMGLLPKGERTFREKADDATRTYLKMRRRWKDLASKFGFKSPKARKSGPAR